MIKAGLTTSVIQRGKTGIAQWIFALTRALEAHRDEVELTLFVLEEDLELFDYAKEFCQIDLVPESFRPPVKDIYWHQYHLPRRASELGLDLLHLPSYRRLIRHQGCATVGTIHDLAPFHLKGKYDWKRMLYGKYVVPYFAHQTTHITAVSQYTAGDITRFFGIPENKITVILNGLDHQRFTPDRDPAAEAEVLAKWQLTKPYFLYVARLEHPGKNHVRLIEAFNDMKSRTGSDWQLVFGGSDWHGAEAIHAAAQASPYADSIRSTGFVPDADLPHLYRAAECFVYPSLFEGFGLPPVEAMACGCPVISSGEGSLREVVSDAGILITPTDTQSISQALVDMATQPDQIADYRDRGLKNAQRFRWELAAKATVETYRHTLEEFRSRS